MDIKKIPAIIIFILLLVVLVEAAPPVTQVQQFNEGYIIKYPTFEYLEANQTVNFNFHVFNISTGFPINSGISCYFHLYNNSGDHLLNFSDITIADHTFDYNIKVTGDNFTKIGFYSYVFQCNSSKLGGYVENYFEVKHINTVLSTAQSIIYFIAFSLAFTLFIISLYTATILPYQNKKEGDRVIQINYSKYAKLFFIALSYVLLLLIVGIAKNITESFLYINNVSLIFNYLYWILLSFMYPLIILAIVIAIVNVFQDNILNKKLKRGFFR